MTAALFHGGTILTVDKDDRVLTDGWISVRDGRIAATGPRALTPPARDFDEVHDLAERDDTRAVAHRRWTYPLLRRLFGYR